MTHVDPTPPPSEVPPLDTPGPDIEPSNAPDEMPPMQPDPGREIDPPGPDQV